MLLIALVAMLSSIDAGGRTMAAECVGYYPSELKRRASRVLEGTVTLSNFSVPVGVATVAVERVWKGPLTPQATFYFEGSMDVPNVTVGERRIFFAEIPTAEERHRLGLSQTGPPPLLLPCYGTPFLTPEQIRKLGRARVVKR